MNDTLLLGPTPLGEFVPVAIRGIHRKRMPVREVRGGQTASFALKKVRKLGIAVQRCLTSSHVLTSLCRYVGTRSGRVW